jgi:hypothetical protein
MLTEYNKFIRSHLKGGKMTMKEAAKLWSQKKSQTKFRFRTETINSEGANVSDSEKGLDVGISFGINYTVEKLKTMKFIDKSFKDGKFSLSLDYLYNGEEPRGTARKILCELLTKAVERGYTNEDELVYLFAKGNLNGSYIQLVRMYKRMGFDVYGTQYINSDIFKDISEEREPTDILSRSARMEKFSGSVLMGTSVGKLLDWCRGRF